MRTAAELTRALYEAYQARDWPTAHGLLHPEAHSELLATGEVLDGRDAIVALNEGYPEPWGDLTVLRVVADGPALAACEVEIVSEEHVFRCAAFWRAAGGLLTESAEYWVTVGGEAPGARPD
jgi:ketosteroid isomerase-like protein